MLIVIAPSCYRSIWDDVSTGVAVAVDDAVDAFVVDAVVVVVVVVLVLVVVVVVAVVVDFVVVAIAIVAVTAYCCWCIDSAVPGAS